MADRGLLFAERARPAGSWSSAPMTKKAMYRAAAPAYLALALTGCRQDMQNQPKMRVLRPTTLFADGRSARAQIQGTVARSQGTIEIYLQTGMVDGKEGESMPFPVDMDVLRRGQERYNIYCSPCHSRVGNGLGMIVQRGYHRASDFHTERLRQAPLGHFVAVIANGYGAMPDYIADLSPQDRWAVAAYIRALQLSQNAKQDDLAAGRRPEPLQEIALHAGMPGSFAGRWEASTLEPRSAAAPRATVVPAAPPNTAATIPTALPQSAAKPQTAPDGTHTASGSGETPKPPEKGGGPAGDPASGKALYAQNCQLCHQKNLEGIPPAIPALVGIVDKIGAERTRNVISTGVPTGKPPMPANPSLTDQNLDDLIAYLRASK
jgi:mono/diheme cytochrome c family protein